MSNETPMFDPDLIGQEYSNCNTTQLRPQENITSTSFSGVATFIIDIAKDEMVLPQNSYLVGKFNINSSNAAGAVGPLGKVQLLSTDTNLKPVGCISSGGLMNCFSKLSHEIGSINGNSVVQNIENLPQCNGLLRQTHEMPRWANENSADPFNLVGTKQCHYFSDNSKTSIINVDNRYRQHDFDFIVENAYKQGLQQTQEITLSCKLPIALFMQEAKLYQGQHIVRLTIDSNWYKNMLDIVNIVGTNSANATGAITSFGYNTNIIPNATAVGNGFVGIQLVDLYYYVEYVKINKRPIGKHIMAFESFNCTLHPCVSSGSDNFILPCKPHMLRVIMGFQSQYRINTEGGGAGNPNYNALINPVGMFGYNAINLNQLRIRYLSEVYPQTDYNLQLLNAIYDTPTAEGAMGIVIPAFGNSWDTVRAYEDYYNCMEFDDGEEAMTYQQWLLNPVFCFKFCSTTNQASNLEVFMNLSPTTQPVIVASTGAAAASSPYATTSLSGVTLYILYVYRTLIECDFGEDTVSYKVFNLV